MLSFYKNNLVSLLLLGLLALPFSQAKQRLRRRNQGLCYPFASRRGWLQNQFTFVLLEFEPSSVRIQSTASINGTKFVDAYQSLVNCEQFGALRGIQDAAELQPRAELALNQVTTSLQTALIKINNFYCNACGQEDFKLFYDTSDLIGAEFIQDSNVCNCRGPTSSAFVSALRQSIGRVVNATQIPLLHPDECGGQVITTYSYEGVCPGNRNSEFSFISSSPSQSPTESSTEEPTYNPTEESDSSDCSSSGSDSDSCSESSSGSGSESESSSGSGSGSESESSSEEDTEEPTSTPTIEPTKEPTKKPTVQVTPTPTTTPSRPPTRVPTMPPTVSSAPLEDRSDLAFRTDSKKNCKWVAQKAPHRCQFRWRQELVRTYWCPETCKNQPRSAVIDTDYLE